MSIKRSERKKYILNNPLKRVLNKNLGLDLREIDFLYPRKLKAGVFAQGYPGIDLAFFPHLRVCPC